jgi:hypothetical protein
MKTASPSPAWPSSNIASLRNLPWNLAAWPAGLRSLSGAIAPRGWGEFHPPDGVKDDRHPQESQLTGRRGPAERAYRVPIAAPAATKPSLHDCMLAAGRRLAGRYRRRVAALFR